MDNSQLRGTRFSATASGTTTASASLNTTALSVYITDISGSSTGTAGTWALLVGTTAYWQGSGAISTPISESIRMAGSGTVTFLMNGATATYANISGYTI